MRLLLPSESTIGVATPVEGGHGFVRGSCLQLHEVGSQVFTLGTLFVRLVRILPHLFVGQDLIHLLHDRVLAADDPLPDLKGVRARPARKLVPFRSLLKGQQDTAAGTEQEHCPPGPEQQPADVMVD